MFILNSKEWLNFEVPPTAPQCLHSFIWQILSSYSMPGAIWGARVTVVNTKSSLIWILHSYGKWTSKLREMTAREMDLIDWYSMIIVKVGEKRRVKGMVRVQVGGVAILHGAVVQCCRSLQQSLQNSSWRHSLLFWTNSHVHFLDWPLFQHPWLWVTSWMSFQKLKLHSKI